MNLSIFFDKQGIFNIRENTILRKISSAYKNEYLDYRTLQWDILRKDEKLWSFIREDLWSCVELSFSDTLYLAIVDKKNMFMGYATIGDLDSDYPVLGLELKSEYWRQGHGKETVDMLLETCFKVLNTSKFIVRINSDNTASLALFSKYNIKEIAQEDSEYMQALAILNEGKKEQEKTVVLKEYYEKMNGRYIRRFLLCI